MTTQVSFHSLFPGTICARSTETSGAPLILEFRGLDGERVGEVIFFTGDQSYTDRLILAINGETAPTMESADAGTVEAVVS